MQTTFWTLGRCLAPESRRWQRSWERGLNAVGVNMTYFTFRWPFEEDNLLVFFGMGGFDVTAKNTLWSWMWPICITIASHTTISRPCKNDESYSTLRNVWMWSHDYTSSFLIMNASQSFTNIVWDDSTSKQEWNGTSSGFFLCITPVSSLHETDLWLHYPPLTPKTLSTTWPASPPTLHIDTVQTESRSQGLVADTSVTPALVIGLNAACTWG